MNSLDKDSFGHLLTFIPAREILVSFIRTTKYLYEWAEKYKEKIQYLDLEKNPDILQYLKDNIVIFRNTEITVKNFKIKRYTYYMSCLSIGGTLDKEIIKCFDSESRISYLKWLDQYSENLNWSEVSVRNYKTPDLSLRARVLCLWHSIKYNYAHLEHKAFVLECTYFCIDDILEFNMPNLQVIKVFENLISRTISPCPRSIENKLRDKWKNIKIEHYSDSYGTLSTY